MPKEKTIQYKAVYQSVPGPGAVIDGTVLADLYGWPTDKSVTMSFVSDAEAVRWFGTWTTGLSAELKKKHRLLHGTPQLIKIETTKLATFTPNQ